MKKIICAIMSAITLMSFTFAAETPRSQPFLDKMILCEFLRGTDKGLELNKSLTRAESAVLINRLIGGEFEAVVHTHSHPFTDVPQWASNDVGYIYESGYINGISNTSFAPQKAVSAQEFYAMILRVLGYSEKNGDFEYKNVLSFAQEIGILSSDESEAVSNNFDRDGATVAMYNALRFIPKGENLPLCKIVSEKINASYTSVHADVLLDSSKTYEVMSDVLDAMNSLENYTMTQCGTYTTYNNTTKKQSKEAYQCTVYSNLTSNTAVYTTKLDTTIDKNTETLTQNLYCNRNGMFLESKTTNNIPKYNELLDCGEDLARTYSAVHILFAPNAQYITAFDCSETNESYLLKGFSNQYNLLYDITSKAICDYYYDMIITINKETMLIEKAEIMYTDVWNTESGEVIDVDYHVSFTFSDINSTDVEEKAESLTFRPTEI